jgi:hypothetical protein
MKGMMTLKQFLQFINVMDLTFIKLNGRAFCGTPIGTVYKAKDFDEKGKRFISVHRGGTDKAGNDYSHLEGSLWLVNSAAQIDGTYSE